MQCCPSAKPLVPYSIGCSVMQPQSRFAADADAAAPQLDAVQVGNTNFSPAFVPALHSHKRLAQRDNSQHCLILWPKCQYTAPPMASSAGGFRPACSKIRANKQQQSALWTTSSDLCHILCLQEEPQAAETVLEAPGTAPHAQAASAPAILNRTAWPEIAKDANLSSPSGTLCLTCSALTACTPKKCKSLLLFKWMTTAWFVIATTAKLSTECILIGDVCLPQERQRRLCRVQRHNLPSGRGLWRCPHPRWAAASSPT